MHRDRDRDRDRDQDDTAAPTALRRRVMVTPTARAGTPTFDDYGNNISTAVHAHGHGHAKPTALVPVPPGLTVSLLDAGIHPLDTSTIENPVMVMHAPRGSGCTTLLGALLASLPGLHAAVVLTDRSGTPDGYMHGILPPQVVMNRPPKEVLQAMIKVQQYALEHFPEDPLPRLCLVLDDVLYSTKTMRNDDFKRDLKIAHGYNIAVIIATADASLLPPDIHTFATHVLATRCVAANEPKQLHAKMFVMFDEVKELQQVLQMCQPFEFVVGTLRVPPGGSRALSHVVHSFVAPAEGLPVLSMALPLLKTLSFALEPPGRSGPKMKPVGGGGGAGSSAEMNTA